MYYIDRVERYDVNGYELYGKGKGAVDKYLSDVPAMYIKNVDKLGEGYIILTEREIVNFSCKEREHLKIGEFFTSKEMALMYMDFLEGLLVV